MATCYAPPSHLICPQFDAQNYSAYQQQCEKFELDLCQWAKENSTCPDAGKIISFPVGDGKALYVIFDYRSLIHIPTDDAYDIDDAHMRGLRKSDIVRLANMKPLPGFNHG